MKDLQNNGAIHKVDDKAAEPLLEVPTIKEYSIDMFSSFPWFVASKCQF
jgi:hypothetical protein